MIEVQDALPFLCVSWVGLGIYLFFSVLGVFRVEGLGFRVYGLGFRGVLGACLAQKREFCLKGIQEDRERIQGHRRGSGQSFRNPKP